MIKEGSITVTYRSTASEKRHQASWPAREDARQHIPSNQTALEWSQFWNKYEEIASTFDTQLISRLENEVDISMLFAGLFSAVNTAFIIAIQTNIVTINPAAVANIVDAGGLVSSRAWTTVLSYASLTTSLLAAFGCLLAKQWLGYFKATRSTHGSISSRGLLRQRKFDAMKNSYLNIILDCFPLLLQVSLLLFAISLLGNTWAPYRDVAGIILVATGTGVALYAATFLAALISPDSPFQTPLSRLAHFVFKSVLQASLTSYDGSPGLSRHLRTPGSQANTHAISLSISPSSEEGPAVRWLSQISTDPAVVTVVAKMTPEVDWPVGFDSSKFVSSLWETFRSCFDVQSNEYNTLSFSCSNVGRAYACSKALCHLYAEALYAYSGPDPELRDILASVALYLSSTQGLSGQQEQRFSFLCGLISLINRFSPATPINVPEEELSWVSHILPAFLHSGVYADERRVWVELADSIIPMFSRYEPLPEKVLANHWVVIALIIGMKIDPNDLAKVDKSSAIGRLREEVHAFVDPTPSYWESAIDTAENTIHKTPTNDLALVLHLMYRLLSVEQNRGLTEGQETETGSKCIAGLYEILTTKDDYVWDDGRVIIEVILRTANILPYIRLKALQKSRQYVHHALKHAVQWEDAETVGLLLPFGFDASQQSVDADLSFAAITLLLGSDSPRLYHTAFRSAILALNDHSRHSLRSLLRRDATKLERFVDALLVPLRMVYTIPISSLAEWDDALMTNSRNRLQTTFGYLWVISMLSEDASFHAHLLSWGHIQQCLDIQLDTRASEAAEADALQTEHAFLLLSIIANLGTCTRLECIEAAVHPSATMAKYDPLAWETILRALEYIIHSTPDARLDVDCIVRIARYIKHVYRSSQDVPDGLKLAIAARIRGTKRSALDSALARLLRALDKR